MRQTKDGATEGRSIRLSVLFKRAYVRTFLLCYVAYAYDITEHAIAASNVVYKKTRLALWKLF
jgi:hypothetical protein